MHSWTNIIVLYFIHRVMVFMGRGSFLKWRAWMIIPKFNSVLNDWRTFISRVKLSSCSSIEYTFVLLRDISLFYWSCFLIWQDESLYSSYVLMVFKWNGFLVVCYEVNLFLKFFANFKSIIWMNMKGLYKTSERSSMPC